jgi:hypothetical protein
MSVDTETCRHDRPVEERTPGGPHWGRRVCGDCGKHLQWLPAPLTQERAEGFRLPIGSKHKGRSLAEIDQTRGGRGFLKWSAVNMTGPHEKIWQMIRVYLDAQL